MDDFELRKEFRERQLTKDFNRLNNDIFDPYTISDSIKREFRQGSDKLGISNPYLEALMDINDIVLDLKSLSFEDDFDEFINVEDYLQDESEPVASLPLPQQPMPSPAVVQTAMAPAPGVTNQGLTPIENALLSEEEKQIRLRQRGLV